MKNQVSMFFPTPIGEFHLPNSESINRELESLVLEREQSEESRDRANAGGWHSRDDLLSWDGWTMRRLHETIMSSVEQMIYSTLQMMKSSGMPARVAPTRLNAEAWANVSRFEHYHRSHNHPDSAWSGVYYVTPGTESPDHSLSGLLEIPDPRPYANIVSSPGEPFGQKLLINPRAGMMVLFPSWC